MSTQLACPKCRDEVAVMPDNSLYCRGCRLPVDKAALAGNGHRPQDIPAATSNPMYHRGGKHFPL